MICSELGISIYRQRVKTYLKNAVSHSFCFDMEKKGNDQMIETVSLRLGQSELS